jgi:hypothetical protein
MRALATGLLTFLIVTLRLMKRKNRLWTGKSRLR